MVLTRAEIGLLEKERDDWREIYEAYCIDTETGKQLRAGKGERCGLCPLFKEKVSVGDDTYISCRKCPVVKATRRTCAHHWIRNGYGEQDDNNNKQALYTWLYLNRLIERCKKNG